MVERQRHDRAFAVGYHCCDILFSFGPNAPFHFDPADVRCVVAFQLCSVATTTFGKAQRRAIGLYLQQDLANQQQSFLLLPCISLSARPMSFHPAANAMALRGQVGTVDAS
jgi:hypothetical protein